MTIDQSEFSSLCALAKLSVDEQSFQATADKINKVLQFVDIMQATDTKHVKPLAHPLEVLQRLRTDEVLEEGQRDLILSCAPSAQDHLYLVPQVISSL